MKEFIEKLIGGLEEEVYDMEICEEQFDMNSPYFMDVPYKMVKFDDVKKIVNQLAEEYKDRYTSRTVLEQVMWERDIAIKQLNELGYSLGEKPRGKDKDCSKCSRRSWYQKGYADAEEDLAEECGNDFCEWEDTESLREKGIYFSTDGLYKPNCSNNEDDFMDWDMIRHFKHCPYCGKEMKVVD